VHGTVIESRAYSKCRASDVVVVPIPAVAPSRCAGDGYTCETVFTVLHPLLLWGIAAVAVPILIHLLLRQRPRPRPWAAMRWLLAAAQAAQRRYRLTNLLLLLLRCLIILLIALAIARPALPGFGSGDRLVLIVDRSASMGPRGSDPGPLAQAQAALSEANFDYRSITIIGVADDVQHMSAGSLSEARTAIGRLTVTDFPGGLERVSSGELANQLTGLIGNSADVVLISDFQQDDGAALAALLQPRCRHLARWAVGKASTNALITGLASISDVRPELPSELMLTVSGDMTGGELAVDGGAFLPLSSSAATGPSKITAGLLPVTIPPLTPGDHLLKIRINDVGLSYDNYIELPLRVRGKIPVLAVANHTDYVVAALMADDAAFERKVVQAPALATEPLPHHGLLALRTAIADSKRVSEWVKNGGVLWAPVSLLKNDPHLRELVSDITGGERQQTGGAYRSDMTELNEILARGKRDQVPAWTLPNNAIPLLWAGDAPLVVQLPVENGFVIGELTDLAPPNDESLRARGTFPLWISRTVRRVTASLSAAQWWQAGQPAPQDMTLKRDAVARSVKQGQPLFFSPGVWTSGASGTSGESTTSRAVVIVPSISEGSIANQPPRTAVTTLSEALPQRAGSDWALPLAIAALIIALVEGLIAAWAGRAYGSREPVSVRNRANGPGAGEPSGAGEKAA
jgi:Aerotolerance regulator N-terminal